MAIEEISFYNTNGDEVKISNLVNQMMNFYGLKLEVGETSVTDFSEGSEIRNILEAFAIGLYAFLEEQAGVTEVAFISTSYGTWLDKIGELPFINMPRIEGVEAQGTVTFTLATAQASDYTIPADTIVACSGSGMEFVTVSDCTIPLGELSGEAVVECLTTGEDGNVMAEAIDTIGAGVDTELVSVSNDTALSGGTDLEEDDDYRERLLNNIRADGFGTQGWYVSLCEEVDGVHDVLLVDVTGYTKKVIINGYTKPTSNATLLEVLTKLTDIDNKVLNHSFTVDVPAYTDVGLTITMSVTSEIDEEELLANLTAFVNGGGFDRLEYDGVDINESIARQDLVNCFDVFDNLVEVTSIQSNGSEVTTLTPASNAVLKLDTVTFVQNEV